MAGLKDTLANEYGIAPSLVFYPTEMVEHLAVVLEGVRVQLTRGRKIAADKSSTVLHCAILLGHMMFLRHVKALEWTEVKVQDFTDATTLSAFEVRAARAVLVHLGVLEVRSLWGRRTETRLVPDRLRWLVALSRAARDSERAIARDSERAIARDSIKKPPLDLLERARRESKTRKPNGEETGQGILRAQLLEFRTPFGEPLPESAIEHALRRHEEVHTSGEAGRHQRHSCWGFVKRVATDEAINVEMGVLTSTEKEERRQAILDCSRCDDHTGLYFDEQLDGMVRCNHVQSSEVSPA